MVSSTTPFPLIIALVLDTLIETLGCDVVKLSPLLAELIVYTVTVPDIFLARNILYIPFILFISAPVLAVHNAKFFMVIIIAALFGTDIVAIVDETAPTVTTEYFVPVGPVGPVKPVAP